ncbi:MAG: XRE family transcriptional regulator [Tannerellaceae bacterium]|nr:XRE family transcriptional regulator [Tannerellaceae bacterium]
MLYYIFKDHPELNVSSVARRLGIPQSVMASYLCGIKKPSKERENEIIDTIRKIREELLAVRL